jgi:transposase
MVVVETTSEGATSVGKPIINLSSVTTVGLDLAKHVFQVHCVDASGRVVVAKAIRRNKLLEFFASLPPCLVGLEASGSAHHWARELIKLGHDARMMPPAYVKPYIRRQKNDAADAAAICEAVTRPHMRSVPVKTEAQQAMLLLHRARDLLVRQRTMLICALRSHMAEFGVTAGQGRGNFTKLAGSIKSEAALPELARCALRLIAAQIEDANAKIDALEKEIVARHRHDEAGRRLATIPGIGPIIASALAASVPDASVFKSGRQFAAWLGLVPRQNSTGGKERLGGITKAGDRYLRRLLVVGATGLIRYKRKTIPGGIEWVEKLLARKPVRLVTVALANKMARIAWAILSRGEVYRHAEANAHA